MPHRNFIAEFVIGLLSQLVASYKWPGLLMIGVAAGQAVGTNVETLSALIPPAAIWGAFGAFGAFAHWAQPVLEDRKQFRWAHLPLVIASGAFVGLLGGKIAVQIHFEAVAEIIAGVAGASGSLGFDLIAKLAGKVASS